jgi:hypothetical protein
MFFCYENKTFSPSPDGSENPVTGFGIRDCNVQRQLATKYAAPRKTHAFL